jgi:hypothetical protein
MPVQPYPVLKANHKLTVLAWNDVFFNKHLAGNYIH